MAYQFDFLPVLQNADLLLRGALFTLELTTIGTLLGVGLGILGAAVRAWKIQPFSTLFGVYVELIRNTPSDFRMAGSGTGHGDQPRRL